MSSPTYVIGIDCSTTATKAVVWDQDGHSVAEGRCAFPLSKPRPGWHEQDAEDWWRSTVTALREVAAVVDSRQIGAIGLTHQRETFVCAGEDGRPLRPAIMWLDSRSGPQVKEYGSERMHRITGKVPDPTPALYKLYWLRDHEPGLLERSAKVVDVHGFLVHRLTGNWQTSWATADPLGLVDMETFDWSDEILSELGLGRGQLCELVPPGEVLGELRSDVAQEVGLPAGLPVVAGAGDGQAAGLGANVTAPGNA
jgi:xylulokinase